VSNHVKLASCNHRFKEERHACVEGKTVVTAVTAAEETASVDSRKYCDGDKLCKQLKRIEEEDQCSRLDWREEMEKAMKEGPDLDPYVWEKNIYEDDDTELEYSYSMFADGAAWNFNRSGSPKFSAHDMLDRERHDPERQADGLTLEPTPVEPTLLDGKSYARTSPTFFKARLGSPEQPNTIGLLDNCASLSLLDRKILDKMPGVKTKEKQIRIQGVGTDVSKEF
jgi:hypothetical protein